MRGLRLFVRPIESGDQEALSAFVEKERGADRWSAVPPAAGPAAGRPASGRPHDSVPACGLLGKLLGDIVAVVSLEITGDAVNIEDVLVARELRRKWIGRVMMREVEQLAAKMERTRIVVDDARDAGEFFRRTGFQREGERWVRVVPQSQS